MPGNNKLKVGMATGVFKQLLPQDASLTDEPSKLLREIQELLSEHHTHWYHETSQFAANI